MTSQRFYCTTIDGVSLSKGGKHEHESRLALDPWTLAHDADYFARADDWRDRLCRIHSCARPHAARPTAWSGLAADYLGRGGRDVCHQHGPVVRLAWHHYSRCFNGAAPRFDDRHQL